MILLIKDELNESIQERLILVIQGKGESFLEHLV